MKKIRGNAQLQDQSFASAMICILLIIIGISLRLIPHLANFSPVAAIALFSGYYFKDRWAMLAVTFSMLLLSDYIIGFYQFGLMASVYLAFIITIALGYLIRRKKWYYSLPTSLIASVVFFIVTNWAVWALADWYPHNFSGLSECFSLALPFFRNTIASNLFYSLLFFGLAELAQYLVLHAKRVSNLSVN